MSFVIKEKIQLLTEEIVVRVPEVAKVNIFVQGILLRLDLLQASLFLDFVCLHRRRDQALHVQIFSERLLRKGEMK